MRTVIAKYEGTLKEIARVHINRLANARPEREDMEWIRCRIMQKRWLNEELIPTMKRDERYEVVTRESENIRYG